jgi:hypothetical protein
MKILVPKHVEAGLFDMWVDLWPFRLKMWQLFIIAVGVGIMFSMVNWLKKSWLPTMAAILIASPVFIIAAFIAFFRKSELYIIPFIVKLIRTYVIWTPRTFQRNIIKPAEWEIKLQFAKLNKWEEKNIEQKELKEEEIDKNLNVLNKW